MTVTFRPPATNGVCDEFNGVDEMNKVIRLALASLVLIVLFPAESRPGMLVLKSSTKRATVIELFSSEGCSSCPPADAWLSGLRKDKKLWKDLIPVTFHVDYWDSLGWKDPFAKLRFTHRQQDYGHTNAMSSIYTPGFFRNGREWRPGDSSEVAISTQEAGMLTATQTGARAFKIIFKPHAKTEGRLRLWGGVLGNGLKSEVKRGENGGRALVHDFVVLQDRTVALDKTGNVHAAEIIFDTERFSNAPKSWSVVFWVSREGSSEPLQAVGGEWPGGF